MTGNKKTVKSDKKVSMERSHKKSVRVNKDKQRFFVLLGICAVVFAVFGLVILIGGVGSEGEGEGIKITEKVYGDDVVEMTYFHWERCGHCLKQNSFHKFLEKKYPFLKIDAIEISESDAMDRYKEIAEKIDGLDPEKFTGTPLTIFEQSGKFNVGYGTGETTGKKLQEMIEEIKAEIDANWDEVTMKRTEVVERVEE